MQLLSLFSMIDAVLRFGKWVGERGGEKSSKVDGEGEKVKIKGWRSTVRWRRKRRRVEESGARGRAEKNGKEEEKGE